MSTIYYETSNTLYHHGIKGQKWGVRRFQYKDGSYTSKGIARRNTVSNKEMRKDKKDYASKLYSKIDTSEPDKLRKKAYDLAVKYELSMDDGGGGKPGTPKGTGERYMQLHRKADLIEDQINTKVGKQVSDYMINKYGKDRVNRLETIDNITMGAKVIGVMVGPIAILGAANLALHRND